MGLFSVVCASEDRVAQIDANLLMVSHYLMCKALNTHQRTLAVLGPPSSMLY